MGIETCHTLISFSLSLHGLTQMLPSHVLWFFLYCLFPIYASMQHITLKSIENMYQYHEIMKFNEATLVYPPSLALDLRSKLSNILSPQTQKLNIFKTHWMSSLNLIFLCSLLCSVQINIHSTYNSRPWRDIWRHTKGSKSKKLGATIEDFLLHHLPPYSARHQLVAKLCRCHSVLYNPDRFMFPKYSSQHIISLLPKHSSPSVHYFNWRGAMKK